MQRVEALLSIGRVLSTNLSIMHIDLSKNNIQSIDWLPFGFFGRHRL